GGLPSGVAAPNYCHVRLGAAQRFAGARAVVHAGAEEVFDAGDVQSAPVDPAGEHESAGSHFGAVGKLRDVATSIRADVRQPPGQQDLGTEAAGLGGGPGRELVAADAVREPQVVLDHR